MICLFVFVGADMGKMFVTKVLLLLHYLPWLSVK